MKFIMEISIGLKPVLFFFSSIYISLEVPSIISCYPVCIRMFILPLKGKGNKESTILEKDGENS